MFTGIVEEVGRVMAVSSKSLTISACKVLGEMEPGVSINVNGACLTVTSFDDKSFSVDVMPETLRRTNLGLLAQGDEVNLERSLALGGRVGGHLVQGHIDAAGQVTSIRREGEAVVIEIKAPAEVLHYIVEKGFIAVDGVSLTVTARGSASFKVSMVDFTLKNTNLGKRQIGDSVNLEVDIIAKYAERLSGVEASGITLEFLQEHGFLVT